MARVLRSLVDRFRGDVDPATAARVLAADYQHVFSGDAGHRVLADLLRRSGVLLTTYREGDETPQAMAVREGQRMLGLYIIRQLNETPDTIARFARTGETRELYDHE